MRRYLTFLVSALLLFSFAVHAAAPLCKEYQFGNAGWFKTLREACDAWAGIRQSQFNPGPVSYKNFSHYLTGGGSFCTLQYDYLITGGTWQMTGVSSGDHVYRNVVCEEVCKRIEGKKTNITIGYHATPSDNLKLNPATKYDPFFKQLMTEGGGTTCIAGCEHFMYKPGADTKTWVSQVAGTNGLYRSSADVSATQFATPCGGAPAEGASPSAPIPECNGVLGDVNGATVCLPRNTDTGVDLGGLPDATRGNPPAGEVPPGKDDKERAPGPGGAGNGSGTGGASNGGGASGGPATGSNNKPGGKGCNDGSKSPELPCSGKGELDADGNTDKPEDGKEQAACGAPGQPKCRIDESGTPGSVGDDKYLSTLDPYKSDSDAAREQIKSVGTGIFEPWAMLFSAPPLATCEGFDLPSRDGQSMGTIDPCNVVDGIRTAMAYIWAIAAFWLCLGWVKSANQ